MNKHMKYRIVLGAGVVCVARHGTGELGNVAIVNPKPMRTNNQPVTGLAGRPWQLVDRDALDTTAVTALGVGGVDLKVNYVPDILRQVLVAVFLADVLSNHAVCHNGHIHPLFFLWLSTSVLIMKLCYKFLSQKPYIHLPFQVQNIPFQKLLPPHYLPGCFNGQLAWIWCSSVFFVVFNSHF